jgi:hypothetical protein
MQRAKYASDKTLVLRKLTLVSCCHAGESDWVPVTRWWVTRWLPTRCYRHRSITRYWDAGAAHSQLIGLPPCQGYNMLRTGRDKPSKLYLRTHLTCAVDTHLPPYTHSRIARCAGMFYQHNAKSTQITEPRGSALLGTLQNQAPQSPSTLHCCRPHPSLQTRKSIRGCGCNSRVHPGRYVVL